MTGGHAGLSVIAARVGEKRKVKRYGTAKQTIAVPAAQPEDDHHLGGSVHAGGLLRGPAVPEYVVRGAKPTDRLITSEFVQAVEHPNFKLLCDYYHLIVEGGTPEMAAACGDALRHVHHREPGRPRRDEAGRQGRLQGLFRRTAPRGLRCARSFEGNASDYEAELPAVLEVLKKRDASECGEICEIKEKHRLRP